jgi:hypothetical protein
MIWRRKKRNCHQQGPSAIPRKAVVREVHLRLQTWRRLKADYRIIDYQANLDERIP